MDESNLFVLVSNLIRQAIENPSEYLSSLPDNLPALGDALDDLDDTAEAVAQAADLGAWLDRASQWQAQLETVAQEAFANAPNAVNELIVRFLQVNFPRTAASLLIAGVITTENDNSVNPPVVRSRMDWLKLRDFILDPETLINEQTWEDLFADIGHPHSGRLLSVLMGLLIMAPRTILALSRGELKFLGTDSPPVRGDQALPWSQFRNASSDWFSLTFPFGDPTVAEPNPETLFNVQSGLEPDFSGTLAIRANRKNIGSRVVTDFEMWFALAVDQDRWQLDLGDDWHLRIEPGITSGFGRDGAADEWHGAFSPFNVESPLLPADPADPVKISIGRERPDNQPDIMLGPPYDTRIVIRDLEFYIKLREVTPQFEIGAKIEGFSLVLAPRFFRTFGQPSSTFREGIRFGVDLDIAYGIGRGLTLNLFSDLEFVLFLDWTILGGDSDDDNFSLKLHTIRFVAELLATEDSFETRVNITTHISGRIGPVTLVIDGMGAWLGWVPSEDPRWIGFIPPTGAGLSIEVGPVIGGGFLDWRGGATERYAGLAYVKIKNYEIKAYGVHEKTTEGKTAVVVVMGVTFNPGIPLAYGFVINGFGGIVAINRRLDTDALRERLTSGAVGNVLFAPDPVRNAPIILGDLEALFPATDNVHVAGPTMRISWASFIHFDIGLLFEIATGTSFDDTRLNKVVLLGSAHCKLETSDFVVVDIQLDISGFIDTVKEVIEFDAALVRSSIYEIFTLTGDSAFRTSWGENKYTMLTMGGFHPRFNPEPAQFPEMARLGLAYDSDDDDIWFRFEFYFAITSNTVQTGGLIEVGLSKGLTAKGWISIDALIQFDPFAFEVQFAAGFRVSISSITLSGVKIVGIISGPGPVRISGSFCIELFFFDICWEDSFTLGSIAPPAIRGTNSSLIQALEPELYNTNNLTSTPSNENLIIVNDSLNTTQGIRVISPVGQLTWSQRRARLEVILSRLDGSPLGNGPQGVAATSPFQSGKVIDYFAPGQARDLTASEALHIAAFEEGISGINLGFDSEYGRAIGRNVDVHQFVLPKTIHVTLAAFRFPALVLESCQGRTATVQDFNLKPAIFDTLTEVWEIRNTQGEVVLKNLAKSDAFARADLSHETILPADDIVQLRVK